MATSTTDDDVSYHMDDLKFRSYAGILKAFPSKDIPLFDRNTAAIRPDIKKHVANLHKVAFLLTQYREVVAVMPVRVKNAYSLLVATSMPDESVIREQVIVCRNARKNDPVDSVSGDLSSLSVNLAALPRSAKTMKQYVAENWLQIPWAEHVGMYHHLARRAFTDRGRANLSIFIKYCLLTAHRKNKVRLTKNPLKGPSFMTLVERIGAIELKEVALPLTAPYPGKTMSLSRYISKEDIQFVRTVRPFAKEAFESEPGRTSFDNLHIFRPDLNVSRPLTSGAILQILSDFFAVFLAVLRATALQYEKMPTKPTSESLVEIGNRLLALGEFINSAVGGRSCLLPWMLDKWLATLLRETYEQMTGPVGEVIEEATDEVPEEGVTEKDSSDEESTDEDLVDGEDDNGETLGDEDADDFEAPRMASIPEDLSKWLRLAFATERYAKEVARLAEATRGDFYMIGTGKADRDSQDWKESVRLAYEKHGVDDWESRCDAVISRINFLAYEGTKEERNWMKFARQNPPVNDGVPHCEAVLASLHLAGKLGRPLPGPQLQHSLNIVAPSKPCCPLCAITIEEINVELAAHRHPQLPILFKHTTLCATSLPPGLPQQVRQRILHRLSGKVYESLENFRVKQRAGSHLSMQSEPLSKSTLLWYPKPAPQLTRQGNIQ